MSELNALREFDPASLKSFEDPASIVENIREETPVFYYAPLKVWVVTRRTEVEKILMDWKTFSSNGPKPQVPEQYRDRFPQSVADLMLPINDPPTHTEARSVVQASFAAHKIERLGPIIEKRAHELINDILDNPDTNRTRFDILDSYCLELTTQTIMALMDLPAQDRDLVNQLRDDAILTLASIQQTFEPDFLDAFWGRLVEANEYLREKVDERRNSDAPDVISTLASAKNKDGSFVLSRERAALHLMELTFAGSDTTAQAMANAIMFLSNNEDQLQQAIDDPNMWPKAFEETVRRRPSAPYAARFTSCDAEVGGVKIPKGAVIWLALAGANTDPRHFECPMHYDMNRDLKKGHLAFTKGRHTCPGAPLARKQGSIGLRVLFERLPTLRMIPDQPLDFEPLAILPVRKSLLVSW